MKLIEVNNTKTRRQFLDVARMIYKADPYWVCPLDTIVSGVFDPEVNSFFTHGEATRWILVDEHEKPIGRVAAFINTRKAYGYEQPTGGMGFFECINNQDAAFMLFDACHDWLKSKGMQAMDGPINFGENDNFWGLLVEGFMHPSFGMPYNHPYYERFFEDYGFTDYFEQVTKHLDLTKPFPERFWKIADWIRQKPGYEWRHFRLDETDRFAHDLKDIYDTAWHLHENFTPLDLATIKSELDSARPFLEEEFIWFVYHENDPVAFLVMLPDVNQVLKPFRGKLNWFNKLRFYYAVKTRKINRARITIMGVKPNYQRHGLESGIFWHMQQVMNKARFKHYRELELSWVGDFNARMQALHEAVGASFAKRHRTYRKLFTAAQGEQQRHRKINY